MRRDENIARYQIMNSCYASEREHLARYERESAKNLRHLRGVASKMLALQCSTLIALLLFFGATTSHAQQSGKDAPAAINGRVMIDDGKDWKPARGVTVAVLPGDFFGSRKVTVKATTDADGHYKLMNVPVGRFFIAAIAPAFVLKGMNRNSFQLGKEINIEAGENIENIDFSIMRGGVITGRVTDGDGKPVIAQRISIYKLNENDPKQSNAVLSDFETDDRGVYRAYGLEAARYVVGVGRAKDSFAVSIGARPTYELTYYPHTTDITQAKAINVSAGDEATDIDIQLPALNKNYVVSGRVIDAETNQPVTNATIFLTSQTPDGRRTGGVTSNGNQTDESGEFRIKNVLPGHYGASANIGDQSKPFQNNGEFYSDPSSFEVTNEDVSGVEIKMKRGAMINGVVTLDGAPNPNLAAKISELSLTAYQVPSSSGVNTSVSFFAFANAKVNADGSFRLTGLPPGKVQLTTNASQTKGIRLVRVERDGNAQTEGIEVGQGEQISNVRVIVTYGASVLRGQVNAINGTLPPNARIGISLQRIGGERGAGTTADSLGRFIIEHLVAGTYEMNVTAFAQIEQGKPPLIARTKQTVNIGDNGETKVSVTLDLSSQTPGAKQ